jgi:hypothetical protein
LPHLRRKWAHFILRKEAREKKEQLLSLKPVVFKILENYYKKAHIFLSRSKSLMED